MNRPPWEQYRDPLPPRVQRALAENRLEPVDLDRTATIIRALAADMIEYQPWSWTYDAGFRAAVSSFVMLADHLDPQGRTHRARTDLPRVPPGETPKL